MRLLIAGLFAIASLVAVHADEVMLEDFDAMTPAQLESRVIVHGDGLTTDLVKTDERVGVRNLRLKADIDPEKADWDRYISLRFARTVSDPQTLVFWFRGDRSTKLYLIIRDSKGQVGDVTIGDNLTANNWAQISIPLKDMHVPNAQPPNDRVTLADVAEVSLYPYARMYPQAGKYEFQFDEFSVTTGSGLGAGMSLKSVFDAVKNGGFEQLSPDGKGFLNWNFGLSREAKATLTVDTNIKHSGKSSMLLHNDSGVAPHVYSRTYQTVAVQPNTAYTLSAWIKGEKVGAGNHFTDWKSYNLELPSGSYNWKPIQTNFITKPDQTTVDIGVNIVNVTEKVWVDDVQLKTDLTPLTGLPAGAVAMLWLPQKVQGDDQEVPVKLMWEGLPAEGLQVRLEYDQSSGVKPVLSKLTGEKGAAQLYIPAATVVHDTYTIRATLLNAFGKEIGHAQREVTIFSRAFVEAILKRAEDKLPQLNKLIADLQKDGQPIDYPRVSQTVAVNFIPWIKEDLDRRELERALRESNELNVVLDRAIARCKDALAGQKLPGAPRYVTGEIGISNGVFTGDVRMPDGSVQQRPVYFTGYGHFAQARNDIEKWPSYGMNVIQIEFGPSSVITGPDKVQVNTVEDFKTVLDRAEKNNVAICLLLSPHYFPGWALDKWPELRGVNGGFNSFDIDHPRAREVEEKFLRTVIPMLKGRHGLHSYCISNEPIYVDGGKSQYNRAKWISYLTGVHGDLAGVAKAHRAEYKSWDDVPTPNGAVPAATPLFYDWVRFNDERFSGWHKWMADIIHELDPAAKVHAKIMMLSFDRNTVGWGNDPEQFCELSDIAGNDASKGYSAQGEWANGWQMENMFYDLLRSIKHQPVFDTENHVIWDRDEKPVPGVHIYNIIWQAAMHGEGASTMWVWERTYDHKSDFWGSIMERPDCADQHGRAGLDLMRLAPQVAAFQKMPARAAIVYSRTAMTYNEAYASRVGQVYQTLTFLGQKIGFITEKQLVAGKGAQYRVIFTPGLTHISDAALQALQAYKGLVVTQGAGVFGRNEYDVPRSASAVNGALALSDVEPLVLRNQIASILSKAGITSSVSVTDTQTGKLPWGVEWQVTTRDGKTLVNLVNYTHETKKVEVNGLRGRVTDLISGHEMKGELTLTPLQPVLLQN